MLTRNLLLLVALFSLFSTAGFAQNTPPLVVRNATPTKKNSFGLKGGLNLANLGGNARGTTMKLSFHLGVYLAVPVSKRASIQPEFVYSVQGTQVKSRGNPTLRLNYNYLNVPIMLNVNVFDDLAIQLGPQVGFLATAKATDGSNSQSLTNQLNRVDLGLCFGICQKWNSGASIGVRYNMGLTTTTKDDPANNNGSQSFPNRVLQISVGFAL